MQATVALLQECWECLPTVKCCQSLRHEMYWPATSLAHFLALTDIIDASDLRIACLRGLPFTWMETLSTSGHPKFKWKVIHIIQSLVSMPTDNTNSRAALQTQDRDGAESCSSVSIQPCGMHGCHRPQGIFTSVRPS